MRQVQGVHAPLVLVTLDPDPGHALDLNPDQWKENAHHITRVIALAGAGAMIKVVINAGAEAEVTVRVGTRTGAETRTGARTGAGAAIERVDIVMMIVVITNLLQEETLDHVLDPNHDLHRAALARADMILIATVMAAAAGVVEATKRVSDRDDQDLDLDLLMDLVILNLQDLNQTVIAREGNMEVVVAKSKKEKKSHSSHAYGTHGILTPADMWNKESEFQAWLMEVKNLNPETIAHNKMKDHFIGFMEDYNTVTMPHEKFYNLKLWEDRQRAIRMGEPLPESKQGAVNLMDDEEQLRMMQRDKRKVNLSNIPKFSMSQSQLQELSRVNHERTEANTLRKMGFDAGRRGVRYE
ncbi:hypothetical protein BGX27_006750 [Mortierella sp. AM989]|nr:hypothetical protein BGX27_006750 [Mortierella sp. AM989]